jgi:23S rRNA pseudouridine1911/1915/1917 synthase
METTFSAAEKPAPLDGQVKSQLGISWGDARKLVERGKVTVNGVVWTDGTKKVPSKATVVITPNAPRADKRAERAPIEVVFADAQILVVEKPAGISTVPFDDPNEDTVEARIRALLTDRFGARGGRPSLGVVHRIDKDTSGLLVFTRTWAAKQELASQFRSHTIERRYLALVHGVPRETRYESHLVEDRGDGLRGSIEHQKRRGHTPKGTRQHAVTHVEILERFGGVSLVACRLETGRTHQIRIHLSEAGHPLLGEKVYVRDYAHPLAQAPRLMLHAETLGFTHPTTGENVRWSLDAPADFQQVLDTLRRGERLSKSEQRGIEAHGPIDSARAREEAPQDGPARPPRRQPPPRNHPGPRGKAGR